MNPDADMGREKAGLRKAILAQRSRLSRAWVAEHSLALQERVLRLPEWPAAAVVGCYLSIPGEVMTARVVERGWADGKVLCVPVFDRESRGYGLARLRPDTALRTGPMNVPEPEIVERVSEEALDCVFVPGLAFDSSGGRLGHGGGHYDRILSGLRAQACKVGLAFSFQLVARVPMAAHDVPMDLLVTEQQTIRRAVRP